MEAIILDGILDFKTLRSAHYFFALYLSVTFFQAGIDKISNYRENLEYFRNHFSDSIFSGLVDFLFPIIAIQELLTALFGVSALVGLVLGNSTLLFWTSVLALLTFLSLYAGQRISKDYEGAATLNGYILVALLSLLSTMLNP